MMCKKCMLIRLAAFVLGVGTGFFAGKKYYEAYYAQLAQEEIDSVKEAFEGRPLRLVKSSPNENGMTDEEYAQRNEDTVSEEAKEAFRVANNPLIRSSLEENPYEKAKKNYNLAGLRTPDPTATADKEETEGDEPLTDAAGQTEFEMDLSKVDRTQPYIIDAREFSDEFDHHDKLSLYYYKLDDVLCDEHEEVINDVDGTIGYDALAALDMQTTVWVRNEPLAIDYEVIALSKSYAEQVHGIGIATQNLTPREVRAAKIKKEKKKGRE